MQKKPIPLIALATSISGCLCASDPGNLVPRTVVEDPSLPAIDIPGTRLHSEAFGPPDGPVILVLHGGPGGDYRDMLPLRALADEGYRVAFWDQRGAGLSQRHDANTITLDIYIEDLRQVIEYYAPGRPLVFIGESWGAMYATAFIDNYGDYAGRIRGAILTEPGAFNDRQLAGFMQRLQSSMSFVGEQLNDAFWAEQFLSPADHARADYQGSLLAMRGAPSEHRDPNNLSPLWRYGAVVSARLLAIGRAGFDWTSHLDAFQHEVLFLRGDLNTAATLEQQQEVAGSYPHARIETITNVGHHMIWERTDDYLTHARAYLREIGWTP
jgi:proline iminopeptidase